jgi:hypothetical protein
MRGWLIAFLFWAGVAQADGENLGLSMLGLCHKLWPCQESLQAFKGLPRIQTGWLMQTFADDCRCGRKLLSDPRPKVVRIHIANGPCLRNRRCGQYEIFAGETVASADRKVRKKDERLLSRFKVVLAKTKALLQNAQGELKCYVSPCLECDLSDRARQVLFGLASEYLPGCRQVDSVFSQRCLPGKVCEKHGEKPSLNAPCIADLDGVDYQKADVIGFAERFKHCEMAHLWALKLNLIDPHGTSFIDPRKRTTIPNRNYFEAMARYIRPGGVTPPTLEPLNPLDRQGCKVMMAAHDGPGGFVFKQSDTYPGVVTLLPRTECQGGCPKELKLVRDQRPLSFFLYHADFKGDGRPIYRTGVPQTHFLQVTNAVLKSDKGACRILPRPGFRVD